MGLKDTQKEIYEPDSELEERKHEESEYNPEVSREASTEEIQQEKKWTKSFDSFTEVQKKTVTVGIIAICVFFVVALIWTGITMFNRSSFSSEKVSIKVEGFENPGSNDVVQYRIIYKNENRVSLKDAEIFLNYSENFRPQEGDGLQVDNSNNSRIHIGDIDPHSEQEVIIKGEFFAPQDSTIYINVTLGYTPSNFNSTFQSKGQLGVNIKSSPISINIDAPFEAVTGNEVEYKIKYKNDSDQSFNNIRIKADYPNGFEFISSNPDTSDGNSLWNIGNLNGGEEGSIAIRGKLSGIRNEGKIIQISAESMGKNGEFILYSKEDKLTKIIASPLVISQVVNGETELNINSSDRLRYSIEYSNIGEIGLRNAIVTVEIESEIINFSDIDIDNGFFDGSKKTITWKAADIPGLSNIEPGAKGKINVSLGVLKDIPVKDKKDKNFTVKTIAKIDSPDVPTPVGSNKIIASNELILKLNSDVSLESLGFYEDENIEKSGSMPLKLGEETSFVLHWKVKNAFNDLKDVKVSSYLPTGVVWKNKIHPGEDKDSIEFNSRTNEVIWNIGDLKNGVGIIEDKEEISFQVSIVPQENQVGSAVELLQLSTLTCIDAFTGEKIQVESENKTTNLREDPSIENKGEVKN